MRMRRNEMCRPAPPRPDDDRERPSGRPDRERPTGGPDRERPTGEPDRERPTGRPDRPTGRPDRPTGGPDKERPTGGPDKEKPTGLPEGERPTGKPKDQEGTNSPPEGGNDGEDKEKRSVKSRNARQTSDRIPLIDLLTAVHLPDLCMERRCCDGESCHVRRIAEDLPPLAFCAPVSSLDTGGQIHLPVCIHV